MYLKRKVLINLFVYKLYVIILVANKVKTLIFIVNSMKLNQKTGLDAIHRLTRDGDKILRIEMTNSHGDKRFAEYVFFFLN